VASTTSAIKEPVKRCAKRKSVLVWCQMQPQVRACSESMGLVNHPGMLEDMNQVLSKQK
jgi:hypothetical protein